ncbi:MULTISPECIES: Y-family DNA polymerase [Listeria]|uniref:Y-family DNA polymerase n=1 Tax=Listeria TaxID=1637 RepID=UPI000B58A218
MVHVMDYQHVPRKDILCIDVKSFFASVECVSRGLNPLTTFLVVMSHPENSGGLVLAATPLMKKVFGIQTGARRYELPNDPRIIVAPPRMKHYLAVNSQIRAVFLRYVPKEYFLPYSIDEVFLDVTGSHRLFGTTTRIAEQIQADILKETGLYVTCGIGDNLLLAKLALDIESKHSFTRRAEWRYENVPEKVWRIKKLTDFWGIGERMGRKLRDIGINSIYELSQTEPGLLKKHFGVIGQQLYYHAHGLDYSRINETYKPIEKSFGKNQILERDYKDAKEVVIVIKEMAEEMASRLRKNFVDTNRVFLSIGYSKYSPIRGFRHQIKIQPTDSSVRLKAILEMLFWKYYQQQSVRVIAISFGGIALKKGLQLNLFENPIKTLQMEQLERTIDKIRARYGYKALMHASSLSSGATGMKRSTYIGGHQG